MDRTVEYLLKKYETKDVNEIWTTEHELEYKQNQRHKQRLYTLDKIVNERRSKPGRPFTWSKAQKGRAKYLIKHLDFYLGRTTETQFIVMIIAYVKLESNYNARVKTYYPFLEDYDIKPTTFIKFLIELNKFHINN